MRRWLYIAGAWALTLAVAFGVGRWRRPAVAVTEKATAASSTATATAAELVTHATTRKRATTTTTRPTPAGPVTIVRVEDTETVAEGVKATTVQATAETRTDTERTAAAPAASRWRVSAAAGWTLKAPELRPSIYGAEVSRRVVGPVWAGAWARTDGAAGLSLAVEW